MKARERWRPSKFVYRNGRLMASRNRKEVGLGSRLITDLVAELYDTRLREHARGRLLDLGCGKVPLFLAYRDHVSDNVCVDWENSLHRNEFLDHHCDLTRPLPFADGEFDTIILSDVLEHIPEPQALWLEMSRVLAGGGKILVNVPFYYWIHEAPHDYYRYTEYALRRFVAAAGLELVELQAIGGAPEIMADLFAKNIRRLPVLGSSLCRFAQWSTGVFVRTRWGRGLSVATRDAFPLGYFLVATRA